jgi:hypothetical protein
VSPGELGLEGEDSKEELSEETADLLSTTSEEALLLISLTDAGWDFVEEDMINLIPPPNGESWFKDRLLKKKEKKSLGGHAIILISLSRLPNHFQVRLQCQAPNITLTLNVLQVTVTELFS